MRYLLERFIPQADRRASRQMLWMGMILTVQFVASIAQLLLATRILGLEGFGVLSLFIAVTSVSFGLLSMPGHEAITTYVTRSLTNEWWEEAAHILRFIFMAVLGLALLAYCLLMAFALPISNLLGIEETYVTAMLMYAVTGIFMATHRESLAVLRLAERLPWGFVVTTAGAITQLTGLMITLNLGGGLHMVVKAFILGACVNGFGMLMAATLSCRQLGVPGLLSSWSVKVPSDIIRFQALSFCQSKIGTLGGNIDMLLLGALTNTTQVGLYRAASRIVAITRMPFQPIAPTVQAEYSKYWYTGDGAGLRNMSRRFTILSLALGFSGYGLLLMFHQPIIHYLLGPEFAGTANPLLIMIPGALVFTGVTALYVLPAASGRALPSLVWHITALAAQVVTLILLVPQYGAIGAAVANTIYFSVWGLTALPFAVSVLRRSYRL